MTKIIYKIIISFVLIFLISITYLSTVGIKTDKLNKQISSHVKKIDENLQLQLRDVSIVLDPLKFRFDLKTIGANLKYKNKTIQLERIKSNVSIKSLLNNQFPLKQLNIATKSIEIKNLISFFKTLNNNAKFYIAEKLVKKGYLIADIQIEFDENGNIKENYKINGFVKEGKVDLLKKYNLSKIDFSFKLRKENFELDNFKLSINNKDLLISKIAAKKKKNKFLVSGKVNNKKITLDSSEIKNLIDSNILDLDIEKVDFTSDNKFSFIIDNKFKLVDLRVNSNISIENLIFLDNLGLKEIFPNLEKRIILKDHQINLDYKKNILNINGSGYFQIEGRDRIEYKITKKEKNIDFISVLKISNNILRLNFLNYRNKDKSNLEINIKGKKDSKNNILFQNISLVEKNNNIDVKNLLINDDYTIKEFEKLNLDYSDRENIKNKVSITKKNKDYLLKGQILNTKEIIKNLLKSKDKNKNLFSEDFKINVDIKKIYIDKKNIIKDLNGYLFLKNNNIQEASLESNFLNSKKMKFTIKTKNDEKITTLFSGEAKPLVDQYKFIKGFNEGSLDFYSVEKNNNKNSKLKIYDFKLKELPALTQILTLASLQGIADLLSGEGIRFDEFEMNFSINDQLMTIDEIYAIGPAISLLMSGYVEKDKLISLRGTLVPATTLNKTIGSIPILGNILVGKKTGEGVFGVSFKIKGPPKKLETSVNPIKTLTPRFITRTLEKIKKN